MVILRDALICLSLFISFILAITDYTDPANQTPALQVLWKETQKRCVTMEINKVYSFRQKDVDKITSHTRLVVGHIFKDDEDDDGELWDFQAWWFDLVFIQKRPFDSIWGGKCIDRNGEWECRDGNVFKFKGEVDIQMFQEIDTVVGAQGKTLSSIYSKLHAHSNFLCSPSPYRKERLLQPRNKQLPNFCAQPCEKDQQEAPKVSASTTSTGSTIRHAASIQH